MLRIKSNRDIKKQGVYKISVTDSPFVYIGSSTGIYGRFKEHKSNLEKNKHVNRNLQEYFNKNHILEIEVIEEVEDRNTLWERELFHMYENEENLLNLTKYTKNIKSKGYWSKEQVLQIAELYNNGKSGCEISEILFGNRNYRAAINKLVKGEYYSIFKDLFNYREYSQLGKRRGEFYCSPKYRDLPKNEKDIEIQKDKDFIIENIGKISGRELSKLLNINHKTVQFFIKKYKTENNIDWGEKFTEDIKKSYSIKLGHKVQKFDKNLKFIEERDSINSFKKDGFNYVGIVKSSKTGIIYKNFIFKIIKNGL